MKLSDLKTYKVIGSTPTTGPVVPSVSKGKDGLGKTLGDVGIGILKGVGSTVEGLDTLTRKIPGLKQIQETFNPRTPEQNQFAKELTTANNTAQKVGKGIEQVAEYFVPGAVGLKAAKGAKLLTRVGMGALETGIVGTAQTGSFKEGAKAATIGGAVPVAGKVLSPVAKLTGRLFKGVGTGLSGMSSKQLTAILDNPQQSRQFVKQIKDAGGADLLRKEAKTIIDGVSKVRQDARKAFGEGVSALKAEDINPKLFRDSISTALNKYGSVVKDGTRNLGNVEFSDPKNLKVASALIDKISKTDLDGLSLRKTLNEIENKAYKIATTDERLSYNAFVRDLGKSVKDAISGSTKKLDDINKAFSTDMGLAESVQQIFGKVKFKNAKEILGVSQKLESLFTQKGLSPEIVDDFLKKIDVNPSTFKAGEAVRQVGELAEKSNSIGTNPFEIIRSITSAVVPPKAVREIAIYTGLAENIVKEIATKLSPAARGALFRAILGDKGQDVNNQ